MTWLNEVSTWSNEVSILFNLVSTWSNEVSILSNLVSTLANEVSNCGCKTTFWLFTVIEVRTDKEPQISKFRNDKSKVPDCNLSFVK